MTKHSEQIEPARAGIDYEAAARNIVRHRIAAAKRRFIDADPLDVAEYEAARRDLAEARAELQRMA